MDEQVGSKYVYTESINELFKVNASLLLSGAILIILSTFMVLPAAIHILIIPFVLTIITIAFVRFWINSLFLKIKNPSYKNAILILSLDYMKIHMLIFSYYAINYY